MTDTCDHHDHQVAIEITEIESNDVGCMWCGEPGHIRLEKSKRHVLALCGDCAQVLMVLAGGEE